jgi:hypothetical protein
MRIRTALSEDTTSAALNTKAHAPEHCAIDHTSLDVLGSAVARQVLIRTSAQHLALYTIAEHIDAAGRAAHVGTAGLARLADPTGEPPATLGATVETQFTGGDSRATVRLTEQLLGRGATGGGPRTARWQDRGRHRRSGDQRRPSARTERQVRPGLDRARIPPQRRASVLAHHRVGDLGAVVSQAGRALRVPARPAEPSLTPSRSTARTTARQSSSAAGFPGTRRTTRSR